MQFQSKTLTVRWLFPTICVFTIYVVSQTACFAQGAKSSSGQTAPEGENVEVILKTLKETLDENRSLKKQIADLRDESKKIVSESSALRGQLQIFEKDKARATGKQDAKIDELSSRLKKNQEELDVLQKKLNETEESAKAANSEKEALKEENQRLQETLQGSVLPGESQQIQQLIKESDTANQEAVVKLMDADREKEKLKAEAAELYFVLGNEAFKKRDFESALLNYQRVLQLNPADADAHHNLGIIFDYYVPDPDRAIYHYRNYLDMKPIEENANEIRERILVLRLGKTIIPPEPLKKDHYKYSHVTN
jgi:tetratricopeptide (TPR) repeat protein